MRLRVPATSASAGVPWMGKKRIRCSGGGSSTMSTMCSSSVREVRSSWRGREVASMGFWVTVRVRGIGARRARGGEGRTGRPGTGTHYRPLSPARGTLR